MRLNPSATGNPYLGTKLLEDGVERDFGAPKGLNPSTLGRGAAEVSKKFLSAYHEEKVNVNIIHHPSTSPET